MARIGQLTIEYLETKIKLFIYQESRSNVRFSMTKTGVHLRIPRFYTRIQLDSEIDRCKDWVIRQLDNDPKLGSLYHKKSYATGDIIQILENNYVIQKNFWDKKSVSVRCERDKERLIIELPENPLAEEQLGRLLARALAKIFLPEVTEIVDEINQLYFNEKIKRITLRNNISNWGSCSNSRNISLSTRLLLAPQVALRYVIVHELAHLKEMNHSSKFWKIVEDAMPEYKLQEKYLKANTRLLIF